MTDALVLRLLEDRLGLDPSSVLNGKVAQSVRRRMRELGITESPVYVSQLLGDERELETLIQEVVVSETWFFRDVEPFRYLAWFAAARLAKGIDDSLRILSLPCASGEEPYSIAIALIDAGVPTSKFIVDAVDVSPRLLKLAQAGVYGEFSFRGQDPEIRARHFTTSGDSYTVVPQIRESVLFRVGNLLDDELFSSSPRYHVIFCRNLLIYLTPSARKTALCALHDRLTPDGLFVSGHAESPDLLDSRFEVRDPAAFAYTQRQGQQPERAQVAPTPEHVARAPVQAKPEASRAEARRLMNEARVHADDGELDEALAVCNAALEADGLRADTYCLMASIRTLTGHLAEAEECLRRALYLEPRNHGALTQRASLCERRGDLEGASNYHRRAASVRRARGAEA